MVFLPAPPDAGDGGNVKDRVTFPTSRRDGDGIGQIAAEDFDTKSLEIRVPAAREDANLVRTFLPRQELLNDVPAEEPSAARDQKSHRGSLSAGERRGEAFRRQDSGFRQTPN